MDDDRTPVPPPLTDQQSGTGRSRRGLRVMPAGAGPGAGLGAGPIDCGEVPQGCDSASIDVLLDVLGSEDARLRGLVVAVEDLLQVQRAKARLAELPAEVLRKGFALRHARAAASSLEPDVLDGTTGEAGRR